MIPPHAGIGAFAETSVDIQLPPGKGTTRPFESRSLERPHLNLGPISPPMKSVRR